MYNAQNFGTGPQGAGMISGKWINKKTGSTVHVRDAVLEGDEMIVMTDIGNISGQDFSANYIQMSDEEYDMKGNIVDSKQTTQRPSKPQTPQPQIKMFDDDIVPSPITPKKVSTQNSQESDSIKLIKKLFSKTETKPEISIDIKWADFPANELNMLMNVFDVSKEDIAQYMMTYLDDEELKLSIGKFIEKML